MSYGKIRANFIEHNSAGSLNTQYVVNGSAKSWAHVTGTGTPSADDSLNISSVTDNATGSRTLNYTGNFNNNGYSTTSACLGDRVSLIGAQADDTYSTSATQYRNNDSRNANFIDTTRELLAMHGDLA